MTLAPHPNPNHNPCPDLSATLASEQMGEEMEAITLEAFISVASEQDLVSLAESAYVHPAGTLAPLRPDLHRDSIRRRCTRSRLHLHKFVRAATSAATSTRSRD